MKKSDLYREWARVLDMCEGSNVSPYSCVKYQGGILLANPEFSDYPECYEFAVAILEDKPVFVGDKIYANNCVSQLTVVGKSTQQGYIYVGDSVNYDISILSWNPPKKTFLLNGVDLPCPAFCIPKSRLTIRACFDGINETASFEFVDDYGAKKVLDCFATILTENTK